MGSIDYYVMWNFIYATAIIIFALIYMNVSFLRKYGITGLFVGVIVIVVSINIAQWKTGYISPFATYRLG
jgi:hypothetical protein